MKINKQNNFVYNKNFRNNQNYIISNLDKKFIIYSFFENKDSYIGQLIILLFVFLLPVIYLLLYSFGISIDSILHIILIFLGIYILFAIFLVIYLLMIVINYSYINKFIRKLKYKFYKKSDGILLKNNPNIKYKELNHYLVIDQNDSLIDARKDLLNDFTYIKK